ncbi:MAG TPA: ATP-binding cassette domain-containing protein, partial [Xanthomonadales bacterium]|nr:ATP-binding cassette domain-containing protein [Xanthomonadales bacterium]
GEASGRMVIEAENISIAYDDQTLVKQFSTRIMRGDRVGLIGPNGAGKSSLLRVLLKQEEPTKGRVEHGTRLQIAYFDQHRSLLDPDASVIDVVAEGRQSITVNGKQKHIIGYLGDFLFAPERARSPIRALSGGERNRVLLARLFSQPANLLVMDEPTNDLDVETLELLEDLLMQFDGTLLLVSHDRSFMQNVVTSSLVYEGGGKLIEYVGFEPGRVAAEPSVAGDQANEASAPAQDNGASQPAPSSSKSDKRKLSYKLQQELDQLPRTIEKLETQLETIQQQVADPAFYQGPQEEVAEVLTKLADLETELQTAYDRWDELESS